MDLSPADRSVLEKALRALSRACGDRVITIALCGEAASRAYRDRRSPLSVAVVVDHVDMGMLDAVRPSVAQWKNNRIGTPLLLDPAYIASSLDVFPLEFLDLRDRHRVLQGALDVFDDLRIEHSRVRLEVEEQLRGKLLHLRQSYLEITKLRHLRGTLLDTLPYFSVILRGMLFLREQARSTEPMELLRDVERSYGIELGHVGILESMRVGTGTIPLSDVLEVFGGYLSAIGALLDAVDVS